MGKFFDRLIGDPGDKLLRKYRTLIRKVNEFEAELSSLSDVELGAKTHEFRERLAQGHVLDDLIPEAFAVVRVAAKRAIGQRHFDVQIIGAAVLHKGNIAEMKTGEGKTLVATLSAYLNALTGNGVHIITVNDYLSRRDPVWMGPIYELLGLSVGCLQSDSAYVFDPSVTDGDPGLHSLRPVGRAEAYKADITYGTNNEFGFDYLRDNMAVDLGQQVQRELHYAIIDEVDNIIIDEARTPLIISGPAQDPIQLYYSMAQVAKKVRFEEDYTIDEKTKTISITELGISKIEAAVNVDNLYDPEHFHMVQYVENALRASVLFKKDKEYVIRDGEVVIVDEFTGRLQTGRRWSDGLHQAIEAKEGLKVQRESITYATVTLQNYFRLYSKLSGMTGTAATEAEEFLKIYGLEVVQVPTNAPMIRQDSPDLVYLSERAKWAAVTEEIKECHKQNRPVLVGTTSIEKSEKLSALLRSIGVPHQVLNAKQHETEAHVIAQAGRPGSVTVATNMAGRGTDIILGGNPSSLDINKEEWQRDHDLVVNLGGGHVIGTEHHESRRIDNQLRGRVGRQGDKGSTRFYASMEDELVRRFGGDRAKNVMSRVSSWAGIEQDDPLESNTITKLLASVQSRVEGYHFEARKHLLEYDDVLGQQRESIYKERKMILSGSDLKKTVLTLIGEKIAKIVSIHLGDRSREDWNIKGLSSDIGSIFSMPQELDSEDKFKKHTVNKVEEILIGHSGELYDGRESKVGQESMRILERLIMLRTLDVHWVQHLTNMERLRQGVGLQAFGQRDPLVAYRNEGRRMYMEMLESMRHDVARSVYRVESGLNTSPRRSKPDSNESSPMEAVNKPNQKLITPTVGKTGRNELCPCGSGKKYKRCHGST